MESSLGFNSGRSSVYHVVRRRAFCCVNLRAKVQRWNKNKHVIAHMNPRCLFCDNSNAKVIYSKSLHNLPRIRPHLLTISPMLCTALLMTFILWCSYLWATARSTGGGGTHSVRKLCFFMNFGLIGKSHGATYRY